MFGSAFVINLYSWILSSRALFSLRKKRMNILHCVFDFLFVVFVFEYLWAYCEAIFPFLWLQEGAANNSRKYTLLGSLTGGSDVFYGVTQTVFFPEH